MSFLPTQIRAFLAVAEQGSMRAAADRLGVTPAAVSSSLALLGNTVGVPLFTKEGRGVKLTSAGLSFLQDVRRMTALSIGAVASAKAAMQEGRPPLRIGTVMTAGEAFLGELLAKFLALHSGARIELEVTHRERLWALIAERKVDIGFAEGPPNSRTLRLLAIRHNEYVVAARRGRHNKTTLAAALWFLREPGSGTRAATEQFLSEYGISPRICTIGSPAAIIRCIREGVGVSLLPRDLVTDDIERGILQIVRTSFTPRSRPWYLITSADREISADISRFLVFALASHAFSTPI